MPDVRLRTLWYAFLSDLILLVQTDAGIPQTSRLMDYYILLYDPFFTVFQYLGSAKITFSASGFDSAVQINPLSFSFPKRPISPPSLLCLKALTGAVISAAGTASVSTGGHTEKALGSLVKFIYFTTGGHNGPGATMGLFFLFFFHPWLSLRIHYFVGFGSAFTKLPRVSGYGYVVILDDDLRIVASPSSRLNILEKPVL